MNAEKSLIQDGVADYLLGIFKSNAVTHLQGSLSRYQNSLTNFEWLYESDGLAKKIVDLYPESAYNAGFQVDSNDKETYEITLNDLNVYETFLLASKVARLRGLACVFIGFSDGDDLKKPANISAPIQFLKAYNLNPLTDITEEFITIGGTEIHKSRLLLFKGHESYFNTVEIKIKYQSVLACISSFLCQYRQIPKQLSRLIDKSNQVALGTWGLSNALRQDVVSKTTTNRDLIAARGEAINEGRSINSTILYDKDHEVFDNVSLSLSGIPDLCHEIKEHLALSLDYPIEIIFGNSINQLGSGSVAQLVTRMVWATKLTQWIDNNWTDNLEYLIECLQRSFNLREAQINIPLALILSPQEIGEINKNWSDILTAIQSVYPMEYPQVKEFMDNNFESMFLPEQVPEKIIQPDPVPQNNQDVDNPQTDEIEVNDATGIVSYLSNLLRIDGDTIDSIMEKL